MKIIQNFFLLLSHAWRINQESAQSWLFRFFSLVYYGLSYFPNKFYFQLTRTNGPALKTRNQNKKKPWIWWLYLYFFSQLVLSSQLMFGKCQYITKHHKLISIVSWEINVRNSVLVCPYHVSEFCSYKRPPLICLIPSYTYKHKNFLPYLMWAYLYYPLYTNPKCIKSRGWDVMLLITVNLKKIIRYRCWIK